jgi:transposase
LYGTIGGDLASLGKMIRKLQTTRAELRFVYEAGPCGYEIYGHLRAQGLPCDVFAPSTVLKRSGDRIKTDRRDARKSGSSVPRVNAERNIHHASTV